MDGVSERDSLLVTVAPAPSTFQITCSPAAPIRGTPVHCVASMTDSSAFVLTRLRSSFGSIVLIDSTVAASASVLSYDWTGLAATSTHVEISGSNGAPLFATTDFSVVARSNFVDAVQPTPPPQLQGNGLPVMKAPYPGMHETSNGWATDNGGLGRTWHLFPDYDLLPIRSGPNQHLIFAVNFRWQDSRPDSTMPAIPSGTYLSAALFPSDPFFRFQDGRNGDCGANDMNTLRGETYQHELTHYNGAIQIRKNLKLHQFYESTFAVSPSDSATHAIAIGFNSRALTYSTSVLADDIAIDADPATAAHTSLTCQMRFP